MATPLTRISASSEVNIPHLLRRSESRIHRADQYEGGSTIEAIKQHGCFNFISGPATLYHSVRNVQRAWERRDLEAGIDQVINFFSVPLLLFNGLGVSYELLHAFNILHYVLPIAVAASVVIAGAAISALEFVKLGMIYIVGDGFSKEILRDPFEMLQLAKRKKGPEKKKLLKHILLFFEDQKKEYEKVAGEGTFDDFYSAFTQKIETLIDGGEEDAALDAMFDHLLITSLSFIKERFFHVTPEEKARIEEDMRYWYSNKSEAEIQQHIEEQIQNTLLGKKQMLSRRLNGRIVEEIDTTIDSILLNLHNATEETSETARATAITLFDKMKNRIDKNQITTTIALIGIGMLIAGLLLYSHIALPVLIPILLVGGSNLLLADTILERGWKHTDTWEWRIEDVPYAWMRRIANFAMSIFQAPKETPKATDEEVSPIVESPPYTPPAKVIRHLHMEPKQWKELAPSIKAYV